MSNSAFEASANQNTEKRSVGPSPPRRVSAIARAANSTPLDYIDVSVEPDGPRDSEAETKFQGEAKPLPANKEKETGRERRVLYDVDSVRF